MAVPSPTKSQLRSQALARRREVARSLSPQLRDELEAKLAQVILPHLITARIVAAYYPMQSEISPLGLLGLLGDGQFPVLPWFADRDSRMLFRRAPAGEPGPWGLLQPDAAAPAEAPDVVIVPLVLADRSGTRIGHGKGHYDRALSYLRQAGPVFTIGVGWDEQISDEPIPADPWDVPLDALATPGEWIPCR
jgi:5-formyltetrahydrofolate cyclo-ligase